MRWLYTLLLLLPLVGQAAVGDITGVEISPSGWSGRLWVSGLNTNGAIVTGFTGSNNLGTPKLTFRIHSNGYNADGTTNIHGRIAYAVATLRHPWSNAAAGGPPGPFTNQIATPGINSPDCVVSFALSEMVASPDGVTLDALAGAYIVTNGTGTNSVAITGLAVTNSSLQNYPRTMAWNKTVPWQIVEGSSTLIEIVAAQYFGEKGFPVRAAHFWAVDANGNRTPTNVVTHWTVNREGPIPMGVMSSWLDISGLTSNTNFTNYVKVFPIVGNAATIVDSSDGTELVDSPYLGPVPLWKGPTARVFVMVDRTNGVAAGVAVTNWADVLNGTAVPFTNIQTALNAAALTNLIFNGGTHRSNWHGVVCLITNGAHGWISDPDTPTVTTRAEGFGWLEISNHPASLRADCIIRTNRGNQNIQKLLKVKFSNLTFDLQMNSATVSSGHRAVWWDRCDIKTNEVGTASTLGTFNTNNWVTRSAIARMRGGWNFSGTTGTPTHQRWFFWQNDWTSYIDTSRPMLFAGNRVLPLTNGPTALRNDVTLGSSADPWLIYNNAIFRGDATVVTVSFGLGTNLNRGAFIANNICEVSTNGLQPPFDFMFSAYPGEVCTNALFWNNTVLTITHPPFNHTTNQHTFSMWYSQQNNLYDDYEITLDGGGAPDPWRTNRWLHLYSVGSAGNVSCELNNIRGDPESPGTGNWGFNGLFSSYYAISNTGPTLKYTSHRGLIGTTTGLGNGDYRLLSHSPVWTHNRNTRQPLPFDIYGHSRSAIDPPGAFVAGNVRKGAFF